MLKSAQQVPLIKFYGMTVFSKLKLALLFYASIFLTTQAKEIPLNHENLELRGLNYVQKSATEIRYQRFKDEVLKMPMHKSGIYEPNASNSAGATFEFRTNSKNLKLTFVSAGLDFKKRPQFKFPFAVLVNGEIIHEKTWWKPKGDMVLNFKAPQEGIVSYQVSLPLFTLTKLVKFELDDDATLEVVPKKELTYISLGDSISHGMGQQYSHQNYPFQLAQKLCAQNFNLAVGGGKVSVPVAKMLKDWKNIDFITVLVGYNDLHFEAKTVAQYKNKYSELLDAITESHPESKIFCITPLFTKTPISKKTKIDIADYRKALEELVRENNNPMIKLISGPSISSAKNLIPDSKDPVHLGIEGASLLATELSQIISKELK